MTRCAQSSVLSSVPHWRHLEGRLADSISTFRETRLGDADRSRMILLDTNVVSEQIRRYPDGRVLDWLDAQVIETLCLSTVSLGELLSGSRAYLSGRDERTRRRARATNRRSVRRSHHFIRYRRDRS